MWKSMATTGFSADLHPFQNDFTIKCFAERQYNMCLLQQWSVSFFLDQLLILQCDLLNLMASCNNTISLSDSGNYFVLLSLVLDDFVFALFAFELSSEHWVSGSDCDNDSVKSWTDDRYQHSDFHHCSISDSLVTFWYEFALRSYFIESAKHCGSRYSNVW